MDKEVLMLIVEIVGALIFLPIICHFFISIFTILTNFALKLSGKQIIVPQKEKISDENSNSLKHLAIYCSIITLTVFLICLICKLFGFDVHDIVGMF